MNDWMKRVLAEKYRHVGKRVRVKHSDKYWRYDVNGRFGTIATWYGNTNIAVQLDELSNRGSQYGYFYFAKNELEIIENENKEETTMTINTNNITNYLNVAKVYFTDENPDVMYDYANYIPYLKEGDTCIVTSSRKGMRVGKVGKIIHDNDAPLTYEVVCEVDTTAYDNRVETRKKAAELKAKMQERARQLQDIVLYQTLAKDDPEMAQLLSDFTDLGIV